MFHIFEFALNAIEFVTVFHILICSISIFVTDNIFLFIVNKIKIYIFNLFFFHWTHKNVWNYYRRKCDLWRKFDLQRKYDLRRGKNFGRKKDNYEYEQILMKLYKSRTKKWTQIDIEQTLLKWRFSINFSILWAIISWNWHFYGNKWMPCLGNGFFIAFWGA